MSPVGQNPTYISGTGHLALPMSDGLGYRTTHKPVAARVVGLDWSQHQADNLAPPVRCRVCLRITGDLADGMCPDCVATGWCWPEPEPLYPVAARAPSSPRADTGWDEVETRPVRRRATMRADTGWDEVEPTPVRRRAYGRRDYQSAAKVAAPGIIAAYQTGQTPPVIAAAHHTTPKRVRRILDAAGVVLRDDRVGNSGQRQRREYPPDLVALVRFSYLSAGMTQRQVARWLNISQKTVALIMARHGIPGRKGQNGATRRSVTSP